MAELKLSDFNEMIRTSSEVGHELTGEENFNLQIEDEDGTLYDIQDVKFNLRTKSIHIKFNHDNDDDDYDPDARV